MVELTKQPVLRCGPDSKLLVDLSLPDEQRPSETLIREHFRQSLIRHVLGDGTDPFDVALVFDESVDEDDQLTWHDLAEVFRDRSERIDLSDALWLSGPGKDIFERYLQMQLHGCLPEVLTAHGNSEASRWNSRRLRKLREIETPAYLVDWTLPSPATDEDNRRVQVQDLVAKGIPVWTDEMRNPWLRNPW